MMMDNPKNNISVFLYCSLILCYLAEIVTAWNETTAWGGCQTGSIEALSVGFFDQQTSLLNVYSWMRPSCEGIVRSVTFYNAAPMPQKHFYLAILQPIRERSAGSFRLINYVRVDLEKPLDVGWQTQAIDATDGWKPPLRAGNHTVFGIFYDNQLYSSKNTVIPYAIRMPFRTRYSTYVGALSLKDIKLIQEFEATLELDPDVHYRLPAFYVTLSPRTDSMRPCGPAPVVKHAKVKMTSAHGFSNKSLNPGECVHYECDEGFAMLENAVVACQPDGIFTALPICAKLPGYPHCRDPPKIANAVAKLSYPENQWPEEGAIVSYECIEGYYIVGSDFIRCINKEWTDGPTCELSCGEPPATPEHGAIREMQVSVPSQFGDFIRFACQSGYAFDGTFEVSTCENGTWTKVSNCIRTCGAPPRINHGSVSHRSFGSGLSRIGSYVLYKCDENYQISYPNGQCKVFCGNDARWPDSSILPRCTPIPTDCNTISCGWAPEIRFAVIADQNFEDNQSDLGSFVRYRCGKGYRLVGSDEIQCLRSGNWSTLPTCQKEEEFLVSCGPAPNAVNATLTFSDFEDGKSIPGSIVRYRCNVECKERQIQIVCRANGQWSDPSPQCTRASPPAGIPEGLQADGNCRELPAISNADITYRSWDDSNNRLARPGDVAMFMCFEGYTTDGDTYTLRCDETFSWSPQPLPRCIPIASCGSIPVVPHARIIERVIENRPGDMVRYECDLAFAFNGTATTSICNQGRWSRVSPCVPSCGQPPTVQNGFIQGNRPATSLVGMTVRYACREGYQFRDQEEPIITCQSDSSWSWPLPVCVSETERNFKHARTEHRSHCPPPPAIKNGGISWMTFNESSTKPKTGDLVRYVCSISYVLSKETPADTIVCTAQQVWTSPPRCVDSCGSAPSVKNGYVVSSTFEGRSVPGDYVTYACEKGFVINGSLASSICRSDKTWSKSIKCISQRCPPPDPIENGRIAKWSYDQTGVANHGDNLTYECLSGYRFENQNSGGLIRCDNGVWTQLPRCVRSTCGSPPQIDNGLIMSVTFLSGSSRPGDKARYVCDEGFTFERQELAGEAKCDPTLKQWVDVPKCVVSCGDAPEISNGYVFLKDFRGNNSIPGSFVRYRCYENFNYLAFEEMDDIVCGDSGQWPIDLLPRCRAKLNAVRLSKSSKPPPEVKILAPPVPTQPHVTDEIWFVWEQEWLRSVPKSVDKLENEFRVSLNHNETMQRIRTQNTDEEMWIVPSRLGSDSNDASIVKKIEALKKLAKSCSYIPQVKYGRLVDDGGFYKPSRTSKVGVVLKYKCVAGARLDSVGVADGEVWTVVCRDNGWSELPRCISIFDELEKTSPCGRPPILKNALLTKRLSDSELVYQCEMGFDLAPGSSNEIVTCQASGFWSKHGPTCVWTACPASVQIDNGKAVSSTVIEGQMNAKTGDVLRFQCDDGFELVNPKQNFIKCAPSGRWSPLPECIPISKANKANSKKVNIRKNVISPCGSYPVIENGKLLDYSESHAEYDCLDGFVPTGLNFVLCTSANTWSEAPRCIPRAEAVCESPPSIDNGFISHRYVGNLTSYRGNRVRYSCFEGFTMDGHSEASCQNNLWTVLPQCIRDQTIETCGDAPLIENAIVVSKTFQGGSSVMGSKAVYRCLDRFVMSTGLKPHVTCRRVGQWSQGPRCIRNDDPMMVRSCGPSPFVANAAVVFSSFGPQEIAEPPVGSLVVIECLDGYQLQTSNKFGLGHPNNYIQCAADGMWTPAPECIPVEVCKTLPAIENGVILARSFGGPIASPGDKIVFDCSPGYEIDQSNAISYCGFDGKWTQIPSCKRIEITCEPLPPVDHSMIIYQSFLTLPLEGSVAVFNCLPGFTLLGAAVVTCSNSAWTATPLCIKNSDRCGQLPEIPYATVERKSFASTPVPGDSVRFKCLDGYLMNSTSPEAFCSVTGRWVNIPSCFAVSSTETCGVVPVVQNAQVSYSTLKENIGRVGDVVWFECQFGFEIVGSASVICRPDGQWSPLPFCKPRQADGHCDNPPPISNGNLVGSLPSVFKPGSRVTYSCLPEFTMVGSFSSTCQPDGRWTAPPTCKHNARNVRSCGPPPVVLRAKEVDRNFADGQSVPGSYVTIVCQDPYYLQGSPRLECLANGKWSLPQPRCAKRPAQETTCGNLPVLKHGHVVSSSIPPNVNQSAVGDSIWWNCDDGYVINGYPGVSCTEQGAWTALPTCLLAIDQCPSVVNLIVAVDLNPAGKASDHAKLAKFLMTFPSSWGSISGNRAVNLTVALRGQGSETLWAFTPHLNLTWLETNFLMNRKILREDVAQMFKAIRLQILPVLDHSIPTRLVYLTSAARNVSYELARQDIDSLKILKSIKMYSIWIGAKESASQQRDFAHRLSSERQFIKAFAQVNDLIEDFPSNDKNFISFMCDN